MIDGTWRLIDAFEFAGVAGQESAKGWGGCLKVCQIIFADYGEAVKGLDRVQFIGIQPRFTDALGESRCVFGKMFDKRGNIHIHNLISYPTLMNLRGVCSYDEAILNSVRLPRRKKMLLVNSFSFFFMKASVCGVCSVLHLGRICGCRPR